MKVIFIFSHHKRIKCILKQNLTFPDPQPNLDLNLGGIFVVIFPRNSNLLNCQHYENGVLIEPDAINATFNSQFVTQDTIKVVFIRHGRSEHNEAKEQHKKGLFYNQRDTLLTMQGQKEMIQIGHSFKELHQNQDEKHIVLVSDLQRTHQSAKAFFSTWEHKPASYTVFPCIFEITSKTGANECAHSFITASENQSTIQKRQTNCQDVNVFKLAYDFLNHPEKYSFVHINVDHIRPAAFNTFVPPGLDLDPLDYIKEDDRKITIGGVDILFKTMKQKKEFEAECAIETSFRQLKRKDEYPFDSSLDATYTSVFKGHMKRVHDEMANTPRKEGFFAGECGRGCLKFKSFWKHESNSTFYMLRFICNSIMQHTHTDAIVINFIDFSHVWSQCNYQITFPAQTRRVIMGVGPSGCGKSTVAKMIFKAFPELETVVAIDGGIARDTSIAWRIAAMYNNTNGLRDLYRIFNDISETKSVLFDMIKETSCSMYVPETLTTFKFTSQYTSLDPNWIALIIWQHLHCVDDACVSQKPCPYPEDYQCVGCDVQGRNRSTTEGKKYSSFAYPISMYNAYNLMKHSKFKFVVHNSGTATRKSILACDTHLGAVIQRHAPTHVLNFQTQFPSTYQELDKQMLLLVSSVTSVPVSYQFAESFNGAVSTLVGTMNENFKRLGVKPIIMSTIIPAIEISAGGARRANCKSADCSTRTSFATQRAAQPASGLAGKYTRRRQRR